MIRQKEMIKMMGIIEEGVIELHMFTSQLQEVGCLGLRGDNYQWTMIFLPMNPNSGYV